MSVKNGNALRSIRGKNIKAAQEFDLNFYDPINDSKALMAELRMGIGMYLVSVISFVLYTSIHKLWYNWYITSNPTTIKVSYMPRVENKCTEHCLNWRSELFVRFIFPFEEKFRKVINFEARNWEWNNEAHPRTCWRISPFPVFKCWHMFYRL